MHRVLSLCSLLVLAATPRLLEAQGAISGTVTDLYTAAPLAGVTLSVIGTTLGSATDSAGRYTVSNVPPGTHRPGTRRVGPAPPQTARVGAAGGAAARKSATPAESVRAESRGGDRV